MPVVEPFKAADMPAYESSFHQAKCACRHVSPVSWSEVTNWCLLHCWKKEKLLLVVGWSLHQLVSSSMGLFMFLVGLWLTLLTAGTAHSRGNGTQICVPQNCRLLFLLYYFHTLTDCFLFLSYFLSGQEENFEDNWRWFFNTFCMSDALYHHCQSA